MKAIVLSILTLLFSFSTKAQTDTLLIGTWKIVSMNRDGVYYNAKKDSISFSKEAKSLLNVPVSEISDSLQIMIIAETLKLIASQFRFEFHLNGKFKFVMDSISFVVEGNYIELPSQKIIKLSNKKSLGLNDFDMVDTIKYALKNDLLYLSLDNDDEEFEFVLEKN